MSDMLVIKLESNAEQIVAGISHFPQAMAQGIASALDRRNQLTIAHIVSTKLTNAGPQFLNTRTGRLRGSVRAVAAKISGTSVDSSIGTNVRYAGVHEFGFTGTQQVKSFTRRNRGGDTFSVGVRGGKKKLSSGISTVKGFSRRVNFRERRMFRTGIEEQLPLYAQDISAAIVRAWEEQK